MMDCHIHYAIVTVRFCTDIFSRFFALRNTRAGYDGQYCSGTTRLGSVSFVDAITRLYSSNFLKVWFTLATEAELELELELEESSDLV